MSGPTAAADYADEPLSDRAFGGGAQGVGKPAEQRRAARDGGEEDVADGDAEVRQLVGEQLQRILHGLRPRLELGLHASGILCRIGNEVESLRQVVEVLQERRDGPERLLPEHLGQEGGLQLLRFGGDGLKHLEDGALRVVLHVLGKLRRGKAEALEGVGLRLGHSRALHERRREALQGC